MNSAGEDRLAAALAQALKPPFAIYCNVAWLEKRSGSEPADGEADVVIGHPELGVMVIEGRSFSPWAVSWWCSGSRYCSPRGALPPRLPTIGRSSHVPSHQPQIRPPVDERPA